MFKSPDSTRGADFGTRIIKSFSDDTSEDRKRIMFYWSLWDGDDGTNVLS